MDNLEAVFVTHPAHVDSDSDTETKSTTAPVANAPRSHCDTPKADVQTTGNTTRHTSPRLNRNSTAVSQRFLLAQSQGVTTQPRRLATVVAREGLAPSPESPSQATKDEDEGDEDDHDAGQHWRGIMQRMSLKVLELSSVAVAWAAAVGSGSIHDYLLHLHKLRRRQLLEARLLQQRLRKRVRATWHGRMM